MAHHAEPRVRSLADLVRPPGIRKGAAFEERAAAVAPLCTSYAHVVGGFAQFRRLHRAELPTSAGWRNVQGPRNRLPGSPLTLLTAVRGVDRSLAAALLADVLRTAR